MSSPGVSYQEVSPILRHYKDQLEGMALEIERLMDELARRGVTVDPDHLETYFEYRDDCPKEDA